MRMRLENCNIRSVDGMKEEKQCCDYPQYYIGYVTRPLFSAKYCQTCHTLALNERKWINTLWRILCKPLWNKKKEFHWNHDGSI